MSRPRPTRAQPRPPVWAGDPRGERRDWGGRPRGCHRLSGCASRYAR